MIYPTLTFLEESELITGDAEAVADMADRFARLCRHWDAARAAAQEAAA